MAIATAPPVGASSLARTAPRGTRALARFEVATLLGSPSVSAALLALPQLEEIEDCDVVLERDVRIVEIAAGEPDELRLDLLGGITPVQVACILDGRPSGDGATFTAAALRIAPIAGGVRVATPGSLASAGGAPEPLVARFEAAAAQARQLLAIDGGSVERPVPILVTWGDVSVDLQATLPDAVQASAAAAALGRALAAARQAGAQGIDGVRATSRGGAVEVRVEGADAGTALALRSQVVEAFRMPSGSMAPGLVVGDHLLVLKGREGKRVAAGDVVVFDHPESGAAYMKRVIAVGGERVRIEGGEVRIGGKALEHADAGHSTDPEAPGRLVREKRGAQSYRILFTGGGFASDVIDVQVPPGHVYLLGDNRDRSHDSRHFGPVSLGAVTGRVVAVAASFDASGAVRWKRVGMPVE
jgi:signal peptidase I